MFSSKTSERDAKLAALDRSQAVIEFDMSGNVLAANKNFLDAVGYTLAEVRGKHHSMFVAETDSSAAYREFWAALKAPREADSGPWRYGLYQYQSSEYSKAADWFVGRRDGKKGRANVRRYEVAL